MGSILKFGYCIAILFSSPIRAQESEWVSSDFPNSLFSIVQVVDSQYVGVVLNTTGSTDFENKLNLYQIQLSDNQIPRLSLIELNSITFPDEYYTHAIRYIEGIENWILVQSKVIGVNERNYRIVLCNKNFEIFAETSVDAIGKPQTFFIDSDGSNTYVLGSILGPPDNRILFLNYVHSAPHELPAIFIGQSAPYSLVYVTSMKIDRRTGDMLIFSYDGISVMDKNLMILENFNSTEVLTQDYGHLIGVEEFYYSHGARDSAWDIGYRNIVLHKYDSNFIILKADTLGWPSQDNFPFFYNSIDYKNDEILVGGHLDGPFTHFNFDESVKKFYLAKYDTDLNKVWRKEYGGDRAYVMTGLTLLKNQDCLAYGFITDSLDGNRYAYIMYMDQNGDLISSYTFPEPDQPIVHIENPGNQVFRLNNPQGIDAQLALLDIYGNELFESKIEPGLCEYPVSVFPDGLYIYILKMKQRIVASGKWIKAQ